MFQKSSSLTMLKTRVHYIHSDEKIQTEHKYVKHKPHL